MLNRPAVCRDGDCVRRKLIRSSAARANPWGLAAEVADTAVGKAERDNMSLDNTSHLGGQGPDELVPSRYALRVGEIDVLVISDVVLAISAETRVAIFVVEPTRTA